MEKFRERYDEDDRKRKRDDENKEKAIEMRKRSLETFSDTMNRNDSGSSSSEGVKRRQTGTELLGYLMSKNSKTDELKKKELELRTEEINMQREIQLKELESRNKMFDTMMRQQNEQMQMFARQAEQQKQLMTFMTDIVNNKKE